MSLFVFKFTFLKAIWFTSSYKAFTHEGRSLPKTVLIPNISGRCQLIALFAGPTTCFIQFSMCLLSVNIRIYLVVLSWTLCDTLSWLSVHVTVRDCKRAVTFTVPIRKQSLHLSYFSSCLCIAKCEILYRIFLSSATLSHRSSDNTWKQTNISKQL